MTSCFQNDIPLDGNRSVTLIKMKEISVQNFSISGESIGGIPS